MPKRNLAWIVIVGVIALLMWQLPQTIAGRDSLLRAFGPLVDARAQISKRFVSKVDDGALTQEAVDAGIRAMIRRLGDPHARYLNRREYDRFRERASGRYGGIGVEVLTTAGGLEVLSRQQHSPAIQAGILPGDIITHIDGISTIGVGLVDAVHGMLNGPSGSRVVLTVITSTPGELDAPRDIVMARAVIKVDPVRGWSRSPDGAWRFMLDPTRRIGYIRLVKFTSNVDERLRDEINHLQRQRLAGLILDLRENTGGLLDSAREVADAFLEDELIVRTRGRKSAPKQWFGRREGTFRDFPIVVLVNDSTASAAEIVAGSLRDHGRAHLVGERTYGKGSVQEVVPLKRNGGAIKLTTAYYYLPDGECIHRTAETAKAGTWGVMPNTVVEMTPAQRDTWKSAWRQIGRETSGDGDDANEEPAASAERAAEACADALLLADIQLRAALNHLRKAPRGSDKASPRVSEQDSTARETHPRD